MSDREKQPALFGGPKAIQTDPGDTFDWPIITEEDEAACLECLRATVNFADIHPDTLTIDPDDIEHRVSERTKAIVVVHYAGHPGHRSSASMPGRIVRSARTPTCCCNEMVSG